MSTGEFISVLEKGEANTPALVLYHKVYRRKAAQRERVWDARAVERRHQESLLNHANKPYSTTSPLQLSIRAQQQQKNTEFFNGSVQTCEGSAITGLDKTPDTPPSLFSPVLNRHHTLAEQDQAAQGVERRQCSPTGVKEADTTIEVNKEESPQNCLDGELTRDTAEERVTSHLRNTPGTSNQSPGASGSYHFAQDLTDVTHDPGTLKGPETVPTQNKARVIHIKVTKFILPGNQKKQCQTELTDDSSEKVTSGGRPIVCKLLELKEETVIPYSQTPYSDSNHSNSNSNCNSNSLADLPHSCEADSSPDMLTSSVMTAFVPSWSSRSKKQRPGGGDVSVNPPGQEMNRRGQEVNTSTSLFTRHVAQQPFCGEPKPQTADVFPGMSNKENAHSMSTSGSSLGSLTGSNLFNLRNHEPAKRRVSRAYSAGMPGGKTEIETDPAYLTSPVETVLRPVSPHSQDLRWSRTISQATPFSTTMNAPSPTTGSLLLSLRKTNISSKSTGTPSSPTSSLACQNKKENRMSEPLSYVTLQRNRVKPELRSPPSNTINKPKGGSEFFPLSSANAERQSEGLRGRMFLYPNNNNFEMNNSSSSPYTTSCTDQSLPPTSLQYSNVMNVTKNNPLSPTPGSMLRRQHAVEGESLQKGNTLHTPGLRRTMSNVADTLNNNNNNRVGTMLSKENTGVGTNSHPSDIYSGVSVAYDVPNLNTLAHQTDGSVLRSPPSLASFSIYSKSNHYSKTIDVPSLSNRPKGVSPAVSPQITTSVSPKIGGTKLPSTLLLKDSMNKTSLEQQSTLNTQRPLFMRDSSTDNPLFSPDKTHSPLDRSASLPLWQRKVEDPHSNVRQCPLTQDAVERPDVSPLSRSRGICAPITFSSLRHSPASPTSPATNASLLLSQKREDPFSPPLAQEQNKNLTKIFESSHRQHPSPGRSENLMKGNELSSRNLLKAGPTENLRSGFEHSSIHLPSPASKFNFDVSATERQWSLSKTDSPFTPVSLGSPHSAKERERPSMTSSPYESLRSSWYIPSSASPSPVAQKLERSSSLGSTLNRLETVEVGSTAVPALHSPYLLLRSSEERPKTVDLWPLHRSQLETQGNVHGVSTTQFVSTTPYMTHAKSLDSLTPCHPLWSPQQTGLQAYKQQDDKTAIVRNNSVERVFPIRTELEKKSQLDPSVRITQTQCKKDGKDVTDSQDQKWSLYLSKAQRDSTARGKENKPLAQTLERPKKNSVGSRFDVMLDHFKQSFSIKHKDEAVLKSEAPCSPLRPSGSETVKDCQEKLKYGTQPSPRESPFNSVTKNMITGSPGLAIPDQVTTKPPKGNKRDDSLFKVPQVPQVREPNTKHEQGQRTSYVNQYATLPANWRTSKGSSNKSSLMEFYKVDAESLNNFSSTSQSRRKTAPVCELKKDGLSNNALDQEGLLLDVGPLSSDMKYGLNQRRSFSVSSVQSSRPSGPGRISRSSSRTSSISDLTTLDDLESFGTMADDQQSGKYNTLQIGQSNKSPERIWSPVSLERTSFPWDKDSDPTPPPSPTFSHSPRRLSKGPSPSSPGSRMSQDNLSSPRGHLPSKGYACNLSVFEESSSDCDSTTDDEYYLDGDGDETEL